MGFNESFALSDISCLAPFQTFFNINLVSLKITLVVKLFTKSQETSKLIPVDFILVMTVCRLSSNKMSVQSIFGAKMCSNTPPYRRIRRYALARNTY